MKTKSSKRGQWKKEVYFNEDGTITPAGLRILKFRLEEIANNVNDLDRFIGSFDSHLFTWPLYDALYNIKAHFGVKSMKVYENLR